MLSARSGRWFKCKTICRREWTHGNEVSYASFSVWVGCGLNFVQIARLSAIAHRRDLGGARQVIDRLAPPAHGQPSQPPPNPAAL